MKQQNLNTVIKDGLSKGEGLPYKDEYWNKMDDLLSKTMPSNATQTTTVTKVTTVSKGLQFATALSIATSIAVVTYYTVFSTSNSSTQPKIQQSNTQTHLETEHPTDDNNFTPNSTSDNASDKQEQTNVEQINNTSSNSTAAHPTNQLEKTTLSKSTPPKTPIDKSVHTEIYENRNGNKNSQPPVSIGNHPTINTYNTTADNSSITNQYSTIEETENNDALITKTVDFNLIQPLESPSVEIKINNDQNQPSLPKKPNRHRIIQHASISPFVGINYTKREQTSTSESIMYTNPKQTRIISGINLQLETKYFALRTGLGISTSQLNSSFETSESKYTRDTNYIIVNSNYQTTPSGKPVALIRQQIDSSITSSLVHLHKGSAEYTYLIIPLTIQYRMAHKRYSVFVEGGTLNNFIVSTQSNNSFSTESPDKQASISKYTIQFTGGTGVGYALNSKYTIEAQYNYALLGKSSSSVNWLNNSHLFTIMLTRNIW